MDRYMWLRLARAEGDAGGEPPEVGENALTDRTFTQEDIDRAVRETADRERKRADAAVAKARAEAQRLAGMTVAERMEREREARDAELTRREGELARRELRAQAVQTLSERGLPHDLVGALSYADAEALEKSLGGVETAFRKAVQKGVESRMLGQAPKAGGEAGSGWVKQARRAAGLS